MCDAGRVSGVVHVVDSRTARARVASTVTAAARECATASVRSALLLSRHHPGASSLNSLLRIAPATSHPRQCHHWPRPTLPPSPCPPPRPPKPGKAGKGGGKGSRPAPSVDTSRVITDARFSHVHTDPRFQRAHSASSSFAVDKRFTRMFKDPAFKLDCQRARAQSTWWHSARSRGMLTAAWVLLCVDVRRHGGQVGQEGQQQRRGRDAQVLPHRRRRRRCR